jgi:ferrochelatase
LLVVSFGGPERREDVIPFLENVTRGRSVPRERLLEVAEHYYHFGGVSPINAQNRELIAALDGELKAANIDLPIYFGNRNWPPYIADALREMREGGAERALAFVTSAFSSYSGCRQYRENIEAARNQASEAGAVAPQIDKLRVFYNHPGFVAATAECVREAVLQASATGRRALTIYTAHSIPQAMAATSRYEAELMEACRLVSHYAGVRQWRLCYQSRSGPPTQPWLGPDIGDALREIAAGAEATAVVVAPIGFLSDHLEVLYDLDVEAAAICKEVGLNMVRARTVGVHPRYVRMIRELIEERLSGAPRLALGELGPGPNLCPADCCPPPLRAERPVG